MDKQQQLEQLFQRAKGDQTIQSFEQTRERFVESLHSTVVNHSPKKQFFTQKWMIMLTTIGILTLSLLLVLMPSQAKKTTQSHTKPNPERTHSTRKTADKQLIFARTAANKPHLGFPLEPSSNTEVMESVQTATPINEEIEADHQPVPSEKGISRTPVLEDTYPFPKLTEEEIAITKKKKRAMLKALQKHDKDYYAYIPSGSFDYNGKTVSAQAFYIGTLEVTNFEYRTFLFDLLIQNRKAEFLKAKPDQSQWSLASNGNLSAFTENYFSHKTFNEYPVVNVSREGAELYCKWLSDELRKFVGEKKENNYNDVRLPLRAEWAKAASNEGKSGPYPWGGPFLRNSRGLLLANYTIDSAEVQRFNLKPSQDVTAPSKSYFQNPYGIYNLSGNVAEMVYESMDKKGPGTAGGSWRNSGEELKIYAPDPYTGIIDPKPFIGFRVVSTFLIDSTPKTGN